MLPNSYRQFPSSSGLQPTQDEAMQSTYSSRLDPTSQTTLTRLDPTPQTILSRLNPTPQTTSSRLNPTPQTTSSRLDPTPQASQQQMVSGERSEQDSIARGTQSPQMQRNLRLHPQSEGTNSSDTSYHERLSLMRVQSSPEIDLRCMDKLSTKRRTNLNIASWLEDLPSHVFIFGLPIVKPSAEEDIYGWPSLSESPEENPQAFLNANLLSGFQGMKRSSFSPNARMVAHKLIKYAREHKMLDEWMVWCRNCDRIPVRPVTGSCGHTRCKTCVERNRRCPCGTLAPNELFVDVLTMHLIEKMLPDYESSDIKSGLNALSDGSNYFEDFETTTALSSSTDGEAFGLAATTQIPRAQLMSAKAKKLAFSPRVPMTAPVRFKYARELISAGLLKEAVAHLARVATYKDPIAHSARTILIRTLSKMLARSSPRPLTRQLNRLVRGQATASWLRGADLECPLCTEPYERPLTTPCGHTFCRMCSEKLIDYKKPCALCQRPLYDFNIYMTQENHFIAAALNALDVKPLKRLANNVTYIIFCAVAFPQVAYPLIISNPKYLFVIRRVMESERRTFGIVGTDRHGNDCEYGTMLQICDCVLLENGSFLLSTIGLSRFQVIETGIQDGCVVAQIERVTDIVPLDLLAIRNLVNVSWSTRYEAQTWLYRCSRSFRNSISTAFGPVPEFNEYAERFWDTSDGPAWLWWFIAIMPIRSEIKVLILSTRSLLKRIMAVNRILDAMQRLRLDYDINDVFGYSI